MNDDQITVTGVVGSDPRPIVTDKGVPITSFRLASSRRVFDRETGTWSDGHTNWYTVSAFRRLADNVNYSLRKGEHVVVTGRLRLRAWKTAEKQGTTAEIDAEAIGHDLSWAVTRASRLQSREQAADASSQTSTGSDAALDGAVGQELGAPVDDEAGASGFAAGFLAEIDGFGAAGFEVFGADGSIIAEADGSDPSDGRDGADGSDGTDGSDDSDGDAEHPVGSSGRGIFSLGGRR